MRYLILLILCLGMLTSALAQSPTLFRLSQDDLAGENLTLLETEKPYYQRRAYVGTDLAIFILAIDNVTNEFESFPLEEFIFWKNGKAIVEPAGDAAFEVQAGDYFIQPKGFKGKFNFVGGDDYHLEFSIITKERAAEEVVSPISKAMVIERDILSGASQEHMGDEVNLYSGVELAVNLVRTKAITFDKNPFERVIHVINGVLTLTSANGDKEVFYPGDFFVIPEGYEGSWQSTGLQALRAFEIYKADQEKK